MNFIIVSNYYSPELGSAPRRITNLAEALKERGHNTDVVCPLPNYPKGKIFKNYRCKILKHENVNNVNIHRYWIYPSVSKNPILRTISMFSFAVSLWLFSLKRKKIKKADWIIIQNSPLLISFSSIILFKFFYRKTVVLNVSDLWPLSALELGAIKKGKFYSLLEKIEKFNYKHSDLILGQSQEILDYISHTIKKPNFLYRNLQRTVKTPPLNNIAPSRKKVKIVYAGLLGVAQGIYDLVTNINFNEIGAELHIYGNGNEENKILDYINKNPNHGIIYKGTVTKAELDNILPQYHASIVPLINRIRGAVPSKIFELTQLNVPILFCGGGEGAEIISKNKTGLTTPPADYEALKKSILKLKNMTDDEYRELKENCKKITQAEFNFDHQITSFLDLIHSL